MVYNYVYNIKILEDKKWLILLISVIAIVYFTLLIILNEINNSNAFFYYTKMNSIFVFLLSVLIFYVFKNMKIKPSKIINKIASLTLAVYLIHENYLLRNHAWDKLMKISKITNIETVNIIFAIFISVIGIFAIAAIIEMIRKPIEKLIFKNKKTNELIEKVDEKLL